MPGSEKGPPTEPPGPPLTRAERDEALRRWLERHPIPRTLHPFLRAAVHGDAEVRIAEVLVVPDEDLDRWRGCFALWSSMTVEQAVSEVLAEALEGRGGGDR